jgi:hypothetical protein
MINIETLRSNRSFIGINSGFGGEQNLFNINSADLIKFSIPKFDDVIFSGTNHNSAISKKLA